MSTNTLTTPRQLIDRHFRNGEEFLHSIGDVPMSRVVWDPWPGTATEADLLLMVEQDKRLCELIDGTLVEKPMGSFESAIAGWLIFYLNGFLDVKPIGTVFGEAGMMRVQSGRVRMPDASFFSNARMSGSEIRSHPILSRAPDLAVEVISESNTKAEINQKKREFFQSGTQLMWVIYPREEIVEIFLGATEKPAEILDRTGLLEGGAVMPGFSVALDKLFSKVSR